METIKEHIEQNYSFYLSVAVNKMKFFGVNPAYASDLLHTVFLGLLEPSKDQKDKLYTLLEKDRLQAYIIGCIKINAFSERAPFLRQEFKKDKQAIYDQVYLEALPAEDKIEIQEEKEAQEQLLNDVKRHLDNDQFAELVNEYVKCELNMTKTARNIGIDRHTAMRRMKKARRALNERFKLN